VAALARAVSSPRADVVLVHGALALAVALELLFEVERTRSESSLWVLDSALAALAALVFAWWRQEGLRLLPVLAIALAFHVALLWAHLRLGATGDLDVRDVYPVYGNELVDRHQYPEAEYPVGAILLFALEVYFGGGAAETANGFLMVPCQLLCVGAIFLLRTPHSAWLAALVAIWPLNDYYWEYRFDLVPAAALALGLLLAYRSRWTWSGVALGVGALVKWSPGVSVVVLVAWLLAGRRLREAGRLGAAFAATVIMVNLPFLLWNQRNVLAAYRQGSRAITNESIWYFPLRALGLTEPGPTWQSAGAPHWADTAAVAVQLVLLGCLVVLAVLARSVAEPALAFAALAPVVFLLTNKVFSVQFLVVLTVGWAVAAALVSSSRVEQLVVGLLVMAATFANAFVYPFHLPHDTERWIPYSAAMFLAAWSATAIVLWRAAALTGEAQRQSSQAPRSTTS
jgi:hypothetical protein